MRPTWYLIQYTPDERRHETRNVGVIVTDGETTRARFLGEDPKGALDLRRVPRWIASRPAYRTWVDHWREAIREAGPGDLHERLIPPSRPGKYVVLPPRAPMLEVPDQDLGSLARRLYDELVAISTDESTEPTLEELCDITLTPLRNNRRILFRDDTRVPAPIDDTHQQPLQFHYAAKNGKWHYMRRLNLGRGDTSTWDRVAATLFQFDRLHKLSSFADANRITLALYDEEPNSELEDQLAALYEQSEVINVANTQDAQETLMEMVFPS